MKHIKLFENFEESINEGIVTWLVTGFVVIQLIRFIKRIFGMRKSYRSLVDSLLNTTRFNSGVRYPKINRDNKNIEKVDALQVSEYDDRYYLTFSGPYKSIEDIRLFKKDRKLCMEFNGKPVEINLSNKDYDEFVSIIKSKI